MESFWCCFMHGAQRFRALMHTVPELKFSSGYCSRFIKLRYPFRICTLIESANGKFLTLFPARCSAVQSFDAACSRMGLSIWILWNLVSKENRGSSNHKVCWFETSLKSVQVKIKYLVCQIHILQKETTKKSSKWGASKQNSLSKKLIKIKTVKKSFQKSVQISLQKASKKDFQKHPKNCQINCQKITLPASISW